MPKRNTEFWEAKFRRNVERDAAAIAALEDLGWTAITVWECELKKARIDETMERVVATVGVLPIDICAARCALSTDNKAPSPRFIDHFTTRAPR